MKKKTRKQPHSALGDEPGIFRLGKICTLKFIEFHWISSNFSASLSVQNIFIWSDDYKYYIIFIILYYYIIL